MAKKTGASSPSEFYRSIRPENFSDSLMSEDHSLPREVLAFELDKISANQKQDQFETLGRRLAEKFISPNLIPQVGPTGGGDGKTDTETHPVSTDISDRWFIPKQGWEKDEKWAFAISAKKTWKPKAKKDIENILSTGREYTKIFFITNQLVSSKKKKEAQDEWMKEYKIEVTILDAEWILEKIYSNNLLQLAIDALNLTASSNNKQKLGPNDTERIQELEELEAQIGDPGRYTEFDHQLVEDALESAILSRGLERPKEEVIGKFERAILFANKLKDQQKLLRIYYQQSWTLMNYYDDYKGFLESYKNFKSTLPANALVGELESFATLFNILQNVTVSGIAEYSPEDINIKAEKQDLEARLTLLESDNLKPASSLTAKTHKAFLNIMDSLYGRKDNTENIKILQYCIQHCNGLIDYPFDRITKQIDVLGAIFNDSSEYDKLIDMVAKEAEIRSSQIAAGNTFLKRGGQKLKSKLYKDAVIYFGKAVLKVAKLESKHGLYLALKGLGSAYRKLGLLWASNNCFVAAASFAFKSYFDEGKLDPRTYDPVRELVGNELFIGRLPAFLEWYTLLSVLQGQFKVDDTDKEGAEIQEMLDGCLATRLSFAGNEGLSIPESLPSLLNSLSLFVAEDSALYQLGYIDKLIGIYTKAGYDTPEKIVQFFGKMPEQPFHTQMRYKTNLMDSETVSFESVILGCRFIVSLQQDKEMVMAAEMLLALLESFLATWLSGATPSTEAINVHLRKSDGPKYMKVSKTENSAVYTIEINPSISILQNNESGWMSLMEFIGFIFHQNFYIDDLENKFKSLFADEEVNERMALIFQHRTFVTNVLGNDAKLLYKDWTEGQTLATYPSKRTEPVIYEKVKAENGKETDSKDEKMPDMDSKGHHERSVNSIIDKIPWEEAGWRGFGFVEYPNYPMGIFLGFNNEEAGKKIFQGWVEKFGRSDSKEEIRLTVVRGINKKHPYWYRVVVSSGYDNREEGKLVNWAARTHIMTAESPKNIDDVIARFERDKAFILCPALMNEDNRTTEPFIKDGIFKRSLTVRNAWEIGDNDIDIWGIQPGDDPVIPEGITDAPVLQVLKRFKERNKSS